MTSLPFYAILLAHMGQNYGYETLMTELPTYMKQVLRFSIKEVSLTASPIIPSRVVSNESLSLSPAERNPVCAALPGHVALLDVHLCDCRLDDLVEAVHAHEHQEDH